MILQANKNRRILFLVNHDVSIYNFRLELVERLLEEGYEVHISCPYGDKIEELKSMGCHYIPVELNRHGMNPVHEWKLILYYGKLMKKVKPLVALSYTIKPNLYGSFAAKMLGVPVISNITGLGTAVENKGILSHFIVMLYKLAVKKNRHLFFQNTENRDFFTRNKLVSNNYSLLPGSGVNLERFPYLPYPDQDTVEFCFISRVMKEKGIDEYLEAATTIKQKYDNAVFHICGFCDGNYEEILEAHQKDGIIVYHGMVRNIQEVLAYTHCTVLPSYFEGMSNALLESAACGRPLLTSNVPGCMETFDEGVSGFGVTVRDAKDLAKVMERFLLLPKEEKKMMGIKAREKVTQEFDRQIIVREYLKEIAAIVEEKA